MTCANRLKLTVVGVVVIMTPVVQRLGVHGNARACLPFMSGRTSVWEDR